MMQIVTEGQHQLLAFVDACNRNNYRPSVEEVLAWLDSPAPKKARFGTFESMLALSANAFDQLRGYITEEAENAVEHLLRIGWLIGGPGYGLYITELGTALLREADSDAQAEADVSVVVLGRDDPLAYPQLIGQLNKAGTGMIVDPYMRVEQLHHVVTHTELTRVLTSTPGPSGGRRRADLATMAVYLGSSSIRSIEVRQAEGLHDRLVIHHDGSVDTLGTSMNSVGRHTTVYTPMLGPAAASLSEEYEGVWKGAEILTAPPLPEPLAAHPPVVGSAATKPRKRGSGAKKAPATNATAPAKSKKRVPRLL